MIVLQRTHGTASAFSTIWDMPTEMSQKKVALRADVNLELAQAVQAAAEREHRSIASWVRHVLTERLHDDAE